MQSELIRKWSYINEWYKVNYEKVYGSHYYKNNEFVSNEFAAPATSAQISEIEALVESKLPDDLTTLLTVHNGETGQNNSPFFELQFLDTAEMKAQIEFGLSMKKPANRYIKNPKQSDDLISQVVEEVKSKLPNDDWFKVNFYGGDPGFGLTTVYYDASDLSKKKSLRIAHEAVKELVRQLKEEENETYGWDDIELMAYNDGKVEVNRIDFNVVDGAFPPGTVKPLYFHYRWVPVFSDNGGNYIGVDLDPDKDGVWGQVVIYGRDVYENRKVGNSLDDFFEKVIADIQKGSGGVILSNTEVHIQERLKQLL